VHRRQGEEVVLGLMAMVTMMKEGTKGRVGLLEVRGGRRSSYFSFVTNVLRRLGYSGISIQNPDRPGGLPPGGDMVRDLLRRAAECVYSPSV
jgi:hypothetical protein